MSALRDDVLVEAQGVRKKFCRSLKRSLWYGATDLAAQAVGRDGRRDRLRAGEFWAIDGVSLDMRRGECLGLIGRNGAGKTTLLKMLNGLIQPDAGVITMRGRVGALIALGTGFNPLLTGRENIYVNASVLGLTREETNEKLESIIEFAELRDVIDAPVQSYSSGMQVRLGYAIAASVKPDVLLVDEVLAVGDVAFQRKCIRGMQRYVEGGGSLILVAHNMDAILSVCTRCAVIERGTLAFLGPTAEGVKAYYGLQRAAPAGSFEGPLTKPSEKDPVVIEAVSVSSDDGGPIVTGRPMRVTVRYRSLRVIDRVAWGLSIWTRDLQVRIGTATSSWDSHTAALREGVGVLECVIPEMPLVGNAYCLKAGIYDAEHSWPIARVGWDDPPIPFVVESPGVAPHTRRVVAGDLVVLPVQWL